MESKHKSAQLIKRSDREPPGYRQKKAGDARRRAFLDRMKENGADATEAREMVGISVSTYRQWRSRWPEFAAEVDVLRVASGEEFKQMPWMGNFADFGNQWLDRELPYSWFHLLAAEAMEKGVGGSITLLLWPPEHSKTGLLEDFCSYKLAVDPMHRITVGSEKQLHSEKIIGLVRRRMEVDGPIPKYVRRFGPFAPITGRGRSMVQSWSAKHFNVYKSQRSGEREFSLQALGMTGSVIGTRCDLLGVDDPQSRSTLGQTETLLDVFRGDWLTRPGTTGHTVINGSRQGDEDFYDALMKENIIDKLIRLPAYDEERIAVHGSPWLWPERYSEADYARLRRNVGEEVWERTYMQAPRAKADATFTEEAIGECLNPLRSVIHDPVPDIKAIYLGLDPAIGSANGVCAVGATQKKLYVLRCMSVPGLTRTTQIMDLLEELAHQFNIPGKCEVTDVVIESMAFQKALIEDEGLQKLIERFGFRVRPHQTGINKYDENLGVAAMARSFMRREFDIPWADDPATRREMQGLIDELLRWRPFVRGTKLRQDRVMALDVETPLWTTAGWTTIGEVRVGQQVATPSGDTAKIIDKSERSHRPVWRVRLSDGSSLRADADHRWWVEPRNKGSVPLPGRWMTTAQMATARRDGTFKNLRIRRPEPLDLPEADLLVDPYVLGVWLGDGDARQGTIHQHLNDRPFLRAGIENAGYETNPHAKAGNFGILGLRGQLVRLGVLSNKHVPHAYLNASFKQRLALLQGLMDTDGSIIDGEPRPGRCVFGNTNRNLVDAVAFLARSVGFRVNVQFQPAGPTRTPRGMTIGKPFWRVVFVTEADRPCPFRLPRKVARTSYAPSKRRSDYLNVHAVEPDGEAEVQCITVDHPSSLFLAGKDLVPTGNSLWFPWILWRDRRHEMTADSAAFGFKGLPYRPTGYTPSGLAVVRSGS